MLRTVATALYALVALLLLLLVATGAPLMDAPQSVAAWMLVGVMLVVDFRCLRAMRGATPGRRALLAEAMLVASAGSTLAVSSMLSIAMRGPDGRDAVMGIVVLYLAWRAFRVVRHLRAGTEPAPRTSAIADAKRMIEEARRNARDR